MRMTPEQYKAINSKQGAATAKNRLQALGRLKPGQMNKTEAAYAAYLESEKHAGEVLWYSFEGIKLKLAPNTHLTVDFAVMGRDGVLEMRDVKGSKAIVQDDSRAKIKIAASLFPFRFALVYPVPKSKGGGWEVEEI